MHIPFCVQKCLYCDFPSYPLAHLAASYIEALARETELYRELKVGITSVYIGGGTPTCLTLDELERLLAMLHRSFDIVKDAEFTVEANPGTVTAEKLKVLLRGGVNRLSFGVQALQEELLTKLGRLHGVKDVYTSYTLAREAGFANINLDLMSGLPEQTPDQWRETLGKAIDLQPEHISAYSLKVEEGTPFAEQERAGTLLLPDEDTNASMFVSTAHMLTAAGYKHYEISNYAKPGCQSLHNLRYWHNESYIGIGASAWTYWEGCRRGNKADVERYIEDMYLGRSVVAEQERPDTGQAMAETMMLGLRLIAGVNRVEFRNRYAVDILDIYQAQIEKMQKLNLLEVSDQAVRLTNKGLLLGNEVFAEFV